MTLEEHLYLKIDSTYDTYYRDVCLARRVVDAAYVTLKWCLFLRPRPKVYLSPDLFEDLEHELEKHTNVLRLKNMTVVSDMHPYNKSAIVVQLPNDFAAGYCSPPRPIKPIEVTTKK